MTPPGYPDSVDVPPGLQGIDVTLLVTINVRLLVAMRPSQSRAALDKLADVIDKIHQLEALQRRGPAEVELQEVQINQMQASNPG